MDTTPEKGGRKRPSSRPSISADFSEYTPLTESTKVKVVGTSAHYRFITLGRARIYVCSSPPPKDIQDRIDAVVERETSEERKFEVTTIAQQLCADFVPVLKGARREDDSVGPIHSALSVLDKNQQCEFPMKMGIVPPPPLARSLCSLRHRLDSKPETTHRTILLKSPVSGQVKCRCR